MAISVGVRVAQGQNNLFQTCFMMLKYTAAQISSVKGHASSKYRHFYPQNTVLWLLDFLPRHLTMALGMHLLVCHTPCPSTSKVRVLMGGQNPV